MKQNDTKMILPIILIFIFLIGLGFFIEIYKYQDCKKVGHSSLYCFLNAGK